MTVELGRSGEVRRREDGNEGVVREVGGGGEDGGTGEQGELCGYGGGI